MTDSLRSPIAVHAWLLAVLLLASPALAGDGDVVVGNVNPAGDLSINGDAGNNDFSVSQSGNTVTITGNNGTTINGQTSITRNGVTGKIRVRGRDGNDTINVDDVTTGSKLDIDGGAGTNTINVDDCKLGKMYIDNTNGAINVSDTSWTKRKVDQGNGTCTAGVNGRGGAGSVGTPPTTGGGGGSMQGGTPNLPSGASRRGVDLQQREHGAHGVQRRGTGSPSGSHGAQRRGSGAGDALRGVNPQGNQGRNVCRPRGGPNN